jgi:hypothetical protein
MVSRIAYFNPINSAESSHDQGTKDSETSDVYSFRGSHVTIGRRFFRSFSKYYSDNSTESLISQAGCKNVPELAAIILSRTQLKRGQPELALELLQSFVAQYGETMRIKEEIARVLSALSRS